MRDTKRKEYEKEYNKKRREDPLWVEKDKERQRNYKSTEKYKEKLREYKSTEKYKQIRKISDWKTKKNWKETDDRFEFIYNKWIDATNCELCNKEFTKKNDKCADHEHNTGTFRSVCCNKCNVKLGVIDRKRMLICLEIHRYFKV